MDRELRERYTPILHSYQLQVEHIEEYGNVVKVHTSQGPYALKKLPLMRRHRGDIIKHIQFLYEKGFTHFAPIYHSKDGRHILSDEAYNYYLMPWLEHGEGDGEENDHYHKMLQTLGLLHQKTVREENITEEQIEHHVTNMQARWEKDGELLEQFLIECESKWYMSPFELQYCTYYHYVSRAHEFANKQLAQWHEAMKEQEKTRVSFVHGNVSMNHFLFDHHRNGYFISFERSHFTTPVQDLIQFYSRSFRTYPIVRSDRYEWYQKYQGSFPFSKEEHLLFRAYLTYPSPFVEQLRMYMKARKSRSEHSELGNTKGLQQSYWLVSNIEYFISQLQAADAQSQS